MGTRTGQSILDRAWIKAQDRGVQKRWDSAEGLMWVNDFQLEAVNLVPRAYTRSTIVTPDVGTRQEFQALGLTNALQPLDIPHNVTVGGGPGSPITKIKRAWMDEAMPNWHQEVATEAQHWTTDEQDPKAFYLYPAVTNGARIRIVYSATPPDLVSLNDPIALDDVYANAAQWFVLFSFFSKDIASIKSSQLAQMHYGLFQQAMGIRDQKLSMAEAISNNNSRGA